MLRTDIISILYNHIFSAPIQLPASTHFPFFFIFVIKEHFQLPGINTSINIYASLQHFSSLSLSLYGHVNTFSLPFLTPFLFIVLHFIFENSFPLRVPNCVSPSAKSFFSSQKNFSDTLSISLMRQLFYFLTQCRIFVFQFVNSKPHYCAGQHSIPSKKQKTVNRFFKSSQYFLLP